MPSARHFRSTRGVDRLLVAEREAEDLAGTPPGRRERCRGTKQGPRLGGDLHQFREGTEMLERCRHGLVFRREGADGFGTGC